MKTALFVFLAIVIIIGSIYGINELLIFQESTQGVRIENAHRKVFEKTQSYIDGKNSELSKIYREWLTAPEQDKKILENLVVTQFENFDSEDIKSEIVKNFLITCRNK